jgi:hypothetical protein
MTSIHQGTWAFVGVAALAVAALLGAACTEGDTIVSPDSAQTKTIVVTGTGSAFGAPDVAVVRVGVSVERSTVAQAREEAARAMDAVIQSVKRNGVEDKDVQTTQFGIQPQYDFPGPNRTQVLRGYRVDNTVVVKVRQVANAAKVIDDAAAAAGNNVVINSISFAIDDPTKLEEAARTDAVREARARAEQLASLTGVKLSAPLTISESFAPVFPQAFVAAPRTGGVSEAATPIEAGELEVRIVVSITYRFED